MWRHTWIAIRFAILTMTILGLIYPIMVTGLAQLMFSKQANGSLVSSQGKIIGSELIGQTFAGPGYFHGRPSAAFAPAGDKDQNDKYISGGSNLAPTSRILADRVKSDIVTVTEDNPGLKAGKVPADMVTTSASGLDPDISPANALAQVARVAKARGISEEKLNDIVKAYTLSRQLGFIGEPRVNLLKLNLALDRMSRTANR